MLCVFPFEWMLKSAILAPELPVALCPPPPLKELAHFLDGYGSNKEDLGVSLFVMDGYFAEIISVPKSLGLA